MDPRQQQIRQITETFHEKVAAYLRPEQAEDYMGAGVLPKRTMDLIRNLTKEETDKSFSLRHPWLTGIPTLGIAPATAKRKALDRIYRSVLRDPESAGTIQQRWDEKRKRQRAERVFDLKQQQIDLVRDKAVQQRRAIVEAMGQAAGAAKHVADRKWGAPQEKTASLHLRKVLEQLRKLVGSSEKLRTPPDSGLMKFSPKKLSPQQLEVKKFEPKKLLD